MWSFQRDLWPTPRRVFNFDLLFWQVFCSYASRTWTVFGRPPTKARASTFALCGQPENLKLFGVGRPFLEFSSDRSCLRHFFNYLFIFYCLWRRLESFVCNNNFRVEKSPPGAPRVYSLTKFVIDSGSHV